LPMLDGVRHSSRRHAIVPPERVRYLSDVAQTVRDYRTRAEAQARVARERWQLIETRRMLAESAGEAAGSDAAPTSQASDGADNPDGSPDENRKHDTDTPAITTTQKLDALIAARTAQLGEPEKALLDTWPQTVAAYSGDDHVVKIRDREIRTALMVETLS